MEYKHMFAIRVENRERTHATMVYQRLTMDEALKLWQFNKGRCRLLIQVYPKRNDYKDIITGDIVWGQADPE